VAVLGLVAVFVVHGRPRPRQVPPPAPPAAPPKAPEASPDQRLPLEGVVRLRGAPVAGVELQVVGPAGLRSSQSGPDGRFAFADLAEGRYALRATHDDDAAYLDSVVVGEADAGVGRLVIELAPGQRLDGRLVDRSGRAIAGGEVTVVEAPLGPLERRVRTEADGGFHVRGVLAGSYVVAARASGFWPAAPRPLAIGSARPPRVELQLERGAVVEGRVLDESGRPVANAQIDIAGEGEGGMPIAVTAAGMVADSTWGRLEPSAELGILRGPLPYPPPIAAPVTVRAGDARAFTSDRNGSFRLVGLPAGRLVVAASHPDYAHATSEPLTTHADATATVTVTLRRSETLRGRLVDGRAAPVAGVEILGDGRTLAVSDGRGEFSVEHVAHELELVAQKSGWLPARRRVAPGAAAFDWTLERAEGRLGGVVVDDRGGPLAGAHLEILAAIVPPKTITTDASGRFHVEALGPGPYRVDVSHADFAPAHLVDVVPGDDATFTLAPGAGLRGDVRDARSGGVPAGLKLELEQGGRTTPLMVDRRGGFEAHALPPGRATLRASAPGFVAWSRELELSPGQRPREITLADVRVELERGGLVVGRLRNDDGDPVPNASIVLGPLRARTDAHGEFRIDGVAAGAVSVRAEANGHTASDTVEVRAGDESHLDLRLR
jgi:protocatechuate 3,4-dioxygenase beta subunit